jgi:hypothetical protein
MTDVELAVPYARSDLLGEIRSTTRVLAETYHEHAVHLTVRAPPPVVALLEHRLGRPR